MNPWSQALKARTQKFAVDVIRFVQTLPTVSALAGVKQQLVDAATSAGDNYRSATRARSHAEFTARLGTVLDEADESENWLDVLYEAGVCRSEEMNRLRCEAAELRAIFARAVLTARENERHRKERTRS